MTLFEKMEILKSILAVYCLVSIVKFEVSALQTSDNNRENKFDILQVIKLIAVTLSLIGCLLVVCLLVYESKRRENKYTPVEITMFFENFVKKSLCDDRSEKFGTISTGFRRHSTQSLPTLLHYSYDLDEDEEVDDSNQASCHSAGVSLHRSVSSTTLLTPSSSIGERWSLKRPKPPGLPVAPRSKKPRIPLKRRLSQKAEDIQLLANMEEPRVLVPLQDAEEQEMFDANDAQPVQLPSSVMLDVFKIFAEDYRNDNYCNSSTSNSSDEIFPSSSTIPESLDNHSSPSTCALDEEFSNNTASYKDEHTQKAIFTFVRQDIMIGGDERVHTTDQSRKDGVSIRSLQSVPIISSMEQHMKNVTKRQETITQFEFGGAGEGTSTFQVAQRVVCFEKHRASNRQNCSPYWEQLNLQECPHDQC